MNDYKKILNVNKSRSQVYAAITEHIADWWSNDLTGNSTRMGDNFSIAFGKTKKTFDIIEATPNKQVVWKCVQAYIDMDSLENKAEWIGTQLIWTIEANDNGTTLTFLHEGLNQSFQCYEVCEAGWDQFLASLHTYLETGKGMPFLKVADNPNPQQEQLVS